MSLNQVKHSTLTSGEMDHLLEQVFKDAPDLSFIAEEKNDNKKLRRSTVGDHFDTTLEREVYEEVKGFQSNLAAHSILSNSIDETGGSETLQYEDQGLLRSTAGEDTVRFDKALLEETHDDSTLTVLLNATSQDHSSNSWLMDELKKDTAREAEDSKEDTLEITLEDSFLQWKYQYEKY